MSAEQTQFWDVGHELCRVRVGRPVEDVVNGAELHEMAVGENSDKLRDGAHEGDVVSDEDKRQMPLPLQAAQQLTITAWTETSREDVTSSHTSKSGSTTRALAMATRCRSPPESSSG